MCASVEALQLGAGRISIISLTSPSPLHACTAAATTADSSMQAKSEDVALDAPSSAATR
jgi:hypothetical protein